MRSNLWSAYLQTGMRFLGLGSLGFSGLQIPYLSILGVLIDGETPLSGSISRKENYTISSAKSSQIPSLSTDVTAVTRLEICFQLNMNQG